MSDYTHISRLMIFGAGPRKKLLYCGGTLRDIATGDLIHQWQIDHEQFTDAPVGVTLTQADGQPVHITETENGVFIDDTRIAGTEAPVNMPTFDGSTYAKQLRWLHHELLTQFTLDGQPVPNVLVYRKAWYRDAAMVAMCLQQTDNLHLIAPWVETIDDPYDHNNGCDEPDNFGQALYAISLTSGKNHKMVQPIIDEAERRRDSNGYLHGKTDGKPRPVYQTKWMKFGLRALGLDDAAWPIPSVVDEYSELFWWDYKDEHVQGERRAPSEPYPYLTWAMNHFHGDPPPMELLADLPPLTWEARASAADYPAMSIVSEAAVHAKWSGPHTWHAAEAFLYLREL